MKEFLIHNWRLIADIVSIIVVVVFFFIKKRPVTDLKSLLYELCELAVVGAEKTTLKGEEKLAFAVGLVKASLLSRFPNLDFNKYYDLVVMLIENILSTPKKKEEISNEN